MNAEKYLSFYKSPLGSRVLDYEVAYIRSWFSGCRKLLDIGCGVGIFEERLRGFDITGIDNSSDMLKLAGKSCVQADAGNLPFPNNSFDGAFFVTSLEFMEDPERAIEEAARVLRPEGKLLLLLLNRSSDYFRDRLSRGGYISQHIQALDKEWLQTVLKRFFSIKAEYILGITGDKIIESRDPRICALYALRGIKKKT